MKITTMNRNKKKKKKRHGALNCNTTALPFIGFFNETILSWQLNSFLVQPERGSDFKTMG